MKTRFFREHNYKAVYVYGKTFHIRLEPSKPIGELIYPEKYVVVLDGAVDAIPKINSFFGDMGENELPFEVIIDRETTLHPQFIPCIKEFYRFGIDVSFVTDGSFTKLQARDRKKFDESVPRFTKEIIFECGVHNLDIYYDALTTLSSSVDIKIEFKLSDFDSIDFFKNLYEEWDMYRDNLIIDLGDVEDYDYLLDVLDDRIHQVKIKESLNPRFVKTLDLKEMKIGPVV